MLARLVGSSLFGILFALSSLQGQAPSSERAEIAHLRQLVGTWRDSTGRELIGILAASGKGVRTEFRMSLEGQPYVAESMWAFDPTLARVRVLEVNSLGQILLHEGRFAAPDTLVLERRSVRDSTRVLQRSVMAFRPDAIHFLASQPRADGSESRTEFWFSRAK